MFRDACGGACSWCISMQLNELEVCRETDQVSAWRKHGDVGFRDCSFGKHIDNPSSWCNTLFCECSCGCRIDFYHCSWCGQRLKQQKQQKQPPAQGEQAQGELPESCQSALATSAVPLALSVQRRGLIWGDASHHPIFWSSFEFSNCNPSSGGVTRPKKVLFFQKQGPPPDLTERTHPPRGGFLFTMFLHQEPCVRGPPSKNLLQILQGGSSSHGSRWGNIVNSNPPRGGGFLSIIVQNSTRGRESCVTRQRLAKAFVIGKTPFAKPHPFPTTARNMAHPHAWSTGWEKVESSSARGQRSVAAAVGLTRYAALACVGADQVRSSPLSTQLALSHSTVRGPWASSWASQGRRTHDPRSPTSQPHLVPP